MGWITNLSTPIYRIYICLCLTIQGLDTELGRYEGRLQAMRSSQSEISKVYSETAHREMRGNLEALEGAFNLLRDNCRNMAAKIQSRLEKADKQTQAAIAIDAMQDAR